MTPTTDDATSDPIIKRPSKLLGNWKPVGFYLRCGDFEQLMESLFKAMFHSSPCGLFVCNNFQSLVNTQIAPQVEHKHNNWFIIEFDDSWNRVGGWGKGLLLK